MKLCLLSTKYFLVATFGFVLCFSAPESRADDETKRLIGGLAVGIVGMAINEMTSEGEAQAEEAKSSNKQQQNKSGASASEETKNLQHDLKELGYYHGVIDGIAGSGTQQAILTWKNENCPKDDDFCRNRKLDELDRDVIKDLAENKRNNKKIRERESQRTKERIEEEKHISSVSEKDASDWYNNLLNTVNRSPNFPECRSKQALSDLQDTTQNAAFSNIVNTQIFDLIDAKEVPLNIDVLVKEHGLFLFKKTNTRKNLIVESKLDTVPVFENNRRLCIANAVTNSGNMPIQYSFHIVEGGISNDQTYYIQYEEVEESTHNDTSNYLNSPEFYQRLYVNASSNK